MLRVPKIHNEQINVVIDPAGMSCSWITPSNKHCPYELKAFQHTPFDRLEYAQSTLFNPTVLQATIKKFADTHSLHNAFVSFALAGPQVVESIVELRQASPSPHEFPFPKLRTLIWNYQYLYPTDNAYYAFYVSGMDRRHLFQHQMMAINTQLTINTVTTHQMSLLGLYTHTYGKAFRASQLAVDMHHHNNQITQLISADTLRRQLCVAPTLTHEFNDPVYHIPLCTALGLYISGDLV